MNDNDSNCGNVPIQEVKPDLIEEEEEKVDEELQKEIKKVKIDDSVFTRQDKKNGKEKKEKDEKKNQKKKGIDFMDYANQNNIQIKFQYEEDKYPNIRRDNEKNYQKNNKHYNNKNNQNNNNNNNNYNRNGKKYNNNKNNNENKGGYKKQKKFYKFGGNKFDVFNIMNNNNNYSYQTPNLKEDKDILSYLENNVFGENNLNKDLYIRNRINENGQILIDDLLNYNALKKNNITYEKIIEVIKDNQNLEYSEIEGKNYITVKNYKNMKLNSIEEIISNKKAYKMQRIQENIYQNPVFPNMPYYIFMANNFIY